MSGFTHASPDYLVRSNIWSTQLKEQFYADLQATNYVNWIGDFPDGDTFNIPSIGQAEVDNYVEDTAIRMRSMDTGNFTFTIDQYLSAGTYITDRQKQDAFYTNQLVSTFVPYQHRALMANVEAKIFSLANSQTASNANTINGADHRFVGSGTSSTIGIKDFAKALYALKKANIPQTQLIAVVDPSVEFALNTVTNLVNVSNNPQWEGVIASGMATGMRFVKNIYGFDVYTSQYLAAAASETVSSVSTNSTGVANIFFSAAQNVSPFIGAWRLPPKVEGKRNVDFQRDEYFTTARYGVKLFRPENLVVCLTNTDQVS